MLDISPQKHLLTIASIGQKMRRFLLNDPINGDVRIQTLAEAAMSCATNVTCSTTRRQQTMHDLCFGSACTLLTLEFSLTVTALNAQSLLYQSVTGSILTDPIVDIRCVNQSCFTMLSIMKQKYPTL